MIPLRRWRVAVPVILAAAAVLALWLLPRGDSVPGQAPLPFFALEVRGGDEARLGPDDLPAERRDLSPGSRLEVVLRPSAPTAGAIGTRVFVRQGDQVIERLLTVQVDATGAVRLSGDRAALFGAAPDGEVELVLVVGRTGALEAQAEAIRKSAARGGPGEGEGWRQLTVPVRLVGGPTEGRGPDRGGALAFAGCAEVREGPTCLLAPGQELRIWSATGELTLEAVDGAGQVTRLPARREAVAAGTRHGVTVPDGAVALRVEAAGERWELRLATQVAVPALEAARALRREGRFDDALAALKAGAERWTSADAAAARGLEARIVRQQGQGERGLAMLREALALDEKHGLVSARFRDSFALTYGLVFPERRFSEAQAVLDALDAEAEAAYPQGAAKKPYYEALIALEVGDLRRATALLDRSERLSERLGLEDHRRLMWEVRADVLHALGRADEAAALLAAAVDATPADAAGCRRADLLTNLAWLSMEAREARSGLDGMRSPSGLLDEALALYRASCPDARLVGNALTNRARAELMAGSPAAAAASLAEAEALVPAPDVRTRVWWLELRGRSALGQGRPGDALDHFEELGLRADAALLPHAAWRADLGRAEALDALGRVEDAAAAFSAAARRLQQQALRVPLGAGRAGFVSRHDVAARRHVDFLLRHERDAEAVRAARAGRGRVLAALRTLGRLERADPRAREAWLAATRDHLAARQALADEAAGDWRLPVEALRRADGQRAQRRRVLDARMDAALARLGTGGAAGGEPPPLELAADEAYLLLHPVEDGHVAFVVRPGGITVRRLGKVDPGQGAAAVARAVLGPVEQALDGVRRLRVAASGPLRSVDVHALPLAGEPLVTRMEVVYALDVQAPARADAVDGRVGAVVVSDPRSDAPHVRGVAEAARRSLERAAPGGLRVLGGEAATLPAVLSALDGAEFLHFAGHGVAAGPDGWASELVLAGRAERLGVADVLSLGRAPRRVVLLACEGAAATEQGAAEGLGIAHALLLMGSEVVVAASRRVGDALSADFGRALYAEVDASSTGDLRVAARAAQIAAWRQAPKADWASWRVLVR